MKEELIGLSAEVVESVNLCTVGMKGEIVDETQNTIVIETGYGKKRLLKNVTIIWVEQLSRRIDCKNLKRPEERIKK